MKPKVTLTILLAGLAAGSIALTSATAVWADSSNRGWKNGSKDHDWSRGSRHAGNHGLSFEEIDADGDGMISAAEIETISSKMFMEFDADGDGQVSKDELVASIEKRLSKSIEGHAERMISRMDENEDGSVSIEEFGQKTFSADRFLSGLDSDEDGMISQEEYEGKKWRRGHRMERHRSDK